MWYPPAAASVTPSTLPQGTSASDYLYWDAGSSAWVVGSSSVRLGATAGSASQGVGAVAVGAGAGKTSQGESAIAIGKDAGATLQGLGAIAVGSPFTLPSGIFAGVHAGAGDSKMGTGCIAIGSGAGTNASLNPAATAQVGTIAIGVDAGKNFQGQGAIAIGSLASKLLQRTGCIAIGEAVVSSGEQDANAVAIGDSACQNGQGEAAIAIGYGAGAGTGLSQDAESIVLNASGAFLPSAGEGTFVVKPVRGLVDVSALPGLYYNSTTGEIVFGPVPAA